MEKSKIAEKEIDVAKWLQKQGYDRRVYKEIAPIIIDYLTEFKLLNLHLVINPDCEQCGGTGKILIGDHTPEEEIDCIYCKQSCL